MKRTVLFLCAWLVWCAGQLNAQRQKIDLQGNWAFRLDAEGTGIGKEFPMLPFSETISLPGTTDTNRKGTPNNKKRKPPICHASHPTWAKRGTDGRWRYRKHGRAR